MYRPLIRSLFVAAALLLTTTACDKADAKADAKPDAKADAKKAEPPVVEPPVAEPEVEPAVEPAVDPAAATAGELAEAETADAEADDGGGAAEDEPEPEPKPEPKAAPPKDDDKTASAPKIDGKPLYEKKCKSCHGIDGKGDTTIGKKVEIPSLVKTNLSKAKVVSLIEKGVPDTKMKAFKDKLSKDEIDAVASYVKKL